MNTLTENEKSFIKDLVYSLKEEGFNYLLEVVKEKEKTETTKTEVIDFLYENPEETEDIIKTVGNDVIDKIVNEWFSNVYLEDLIEKVKSNFDLADFIKVAIDEL